MRKIRTPSKTYFLRIYVGKKLIEREFVSKSDVLAISDALRFVQNRIKIGIDKSKITKIVIGDNIICRVDKKGYCDSIKTNEFFIWIKKDCAYALEELFVEYII